MICALSANQFSLNVFKQAVESEYIQTYMTSESIFSCDADVTNEIYLYIQITNSTL